MDKERMTVETVDICKCGIVMHQADAEDYDTLGAVGGTCCPDCGNEKFQTVAQLQSDLKEAREERDRLKVALDVAKDIIRTPFKRHNIRTSFERIDQALKDGTDVKEKGSEK